MEHVCTCLLKINLCDLYLFSGTTPTTHVPNATATPTSATCSWWIKWRTRWSASLVSDIATTSSPFQ